MRFLQPSDAVVRALLQQTQRIAVVGLSAKPDRPSYKVTKSLLDFGYTVIPVNPAHDAILGQRCFGQLSEVHANIDLVDVFRAPEHVSEIVDQCIALKLPAIWLQEGVVDEQAAGRAQAAGITVIMDRCIYKEYRRLL